jgi:6-phosphogluconolactonase
VSATTLRIFPGAAGVTTAVAQAFADAARTSVGQRGAFEVALSGGTTPKAAYQLLACEPFRSQIDWSKVFVYFGDERCVPPDDPASNYRMACEALLDAVPIPTENIFRMRGEADPAIAANEYASLIRTRLGESPHFDLVLLGLGDNAHTASLFPGTPPDLDDNALARAVNVASQNMWRITLTPKAINGARSVVFAVEGAAKAPALQAVLEGPRDATQWPAQVVQPLHGTLTWLVDETAARDLSETTR